MFHSSTKLVLVRAYVRAFGISKESWVTCRVWDSGTLSDHVDKSLLSLLSSFRKDNKLNDNVECTSHITELLVFDNQLPSQYEQPPLPEQTEPSLDNLVASIERLTELSESGIDLSAAINAIQDKIVVLMTAGSLR